MPKDPTVFLDEIETAISAVLNNQTYRLGDRTVTRANLAELQNLRKQLLDERASSTGKRPRVSYADLGGF